MKKEIAFFSARELSVHNGGWSKTPLYFRLTPFYLTTDVKLVMEVSVEFLSFHISSISLQILLAMILSNDERLKILLEAISK